MNDGMRIALLLAAVVAAVLVFVADAALAAPGRGANIGLGILTMPTLALVAYLLFRRPRR